MSNNKSSKCKCCKVCRDSGKPEAVVTSHLVKDVKNGVIVCPTLLATVCRYCKQNGHTVKYCSSIKNKPKVSNNVATLKDEELKVKKVQLEVNTRVNRYGSLSDESDSDTEDTATLLPFPEPPVLQRQSATNAVTVPKRWIDYDTDSDIEQEI
jgi:hypothetical protein